MSPGFMTDFSESRNQPGFGRIYECELWAGCSPVPQFFDTSTDVGQSSLRNLLRHKPFKMATKGRTRTISMRENILFPSEIKHNSP